MRAGHFLRFIQRNSGSVCLKILTASYSELFTDGEKQFLERFGPTADGHPGNQYCIKLLDDFRVHSNHGIHQVLVLPLLGPSLYDARQTLLKRFEPIPVVFVKTWLRQLLLGLDYLHTRVGVIHSGKYVCSSRLPNMELVVLYMPMNRLPRHQLPSKPTQLWVTQRFLSADASCHPPGDNR